MRLIIFVKIPERVDPIPLDITDDRPSQEVVNDILVIAKLSKKSEGTSYHLSRNGIKLNPHVNLFENGVGNGTLIELIKINEETTLKKDLQFTDISLQAESSETIEEMKRVKRKAEPHNPPGKKIDFS